MINLSHLDIYTQSLDGNSDLINKVADTVSTFQHTVLDSYDYMSNHQVLLYGDVQSGKTSHMLGVVAECLDQNFDTVIVLTSPNTRLVDQTYSRIFESFSNVLVCKGDSLNEFRANQHRVVPQKTVIVMGKITKTLGNWVQLFKETKALEGNPVLIIDDEADATSLNTKVNADEISTINNHLTEIRGCATACVYMQVTGTPQAVLLQSDDSEWSVQSAMHFKPGDSYIGGTQFFDSLSSNPYTRLFSDSDTDEDRYLLEALHTYMLTAAIFKIKKQSLCTMLIHPSHMSPIHDDYESRVKTKLKHTFDHFNDANIQNSLARVHEQLTKTYSHAPELDTVLGVLEAMHSEFNTYIINSKNPTVESDWSDGYNIVVGGNSLGRGLTFKNLQTVFYVRESKRPQADTLWQHARMFGYQRHRETMRVFMPATLGQTFQEVHQGNEVIKNQLESGTPIKDMRVVLNDGVSPTRANVLDKQRVHHLIGGVNYFAADPKNPKFDILDRKLNDLVFKHGNDFHLNMQAMIKLLGHFKTDVKDLDLATFKVALGNFEETRPQLTARVIIRTDRKINHGTGVLLSPNDQKISRHETTHPLLILYRIDGVNSTALAKGKSTWAHDPIWVPNIKLPGQRQFWRVDG
ncbi:Z1 domain-containing protein [Yaniella flava]|uniref:Z1 domain-containing protein n=1 Tax=Yaniella flava TaxID=287930 RepID=A0ABP5FVE3_9MICC